MEFAVFRRSDARYWQVIAGGGEHGESVEQAAQREAHEEAGLRAVAPLTHLSTTASVPVTHFDDREHWPRDRYVVPIHYFGVDATGIDIELSREHTEFRWVDTDEARRLLHWQSDAVALWELAQRVQNGHL